MTGILQVGVRDEVFTHADEDGTIRHFNATRLFAAIVYGKVADFELISFDLTLDQYEFMMAHRGVEEPRVARLREPYLSAPGVLCHLPTGRQLLIDGTHRFVRRYRDGLRLMLAFLVPESEWCRYLVHMPPEIERVYLSMLDRQPGM
jgi:hypothetical protein